MSGVAWGVSIGIMVCAMLYAAMQTDIESKKQNAFMMKACVEAGGEWRKGWGPSFDCIRPAQ